MESVDRERRIKAARAILQHPQFLKLNRRQKASKLDELLKKGLLREDLQMLIREFHTSLELTAENLEGLPRDVFRYLITSGELKGQDLVALCGVSSVLSEKCNHDDYWIFRQLLLREFGLKDYHHNPRDLYVTLHRIGLGWRMLSERIKELGKLEFYDYESEEVPEVADPFGGELFKSRYYVFDLLYRGLIKDLVGELEWVKKSPSIFLYGFLHKFLLEDARDPMAALFRHMNPQEAPKIIDPKDQWFDVVRPLLVKGESYKGFFLQDGKFATIQTGFLGEPVPRFYTYTVEDVDNFWDDAREEISKIPEPNKTTLNENYRRLLADLDYMADVSTTENVINSLRSIHEMSDRYHNQVRREQELDYIRRALNSIKDFNIYELRPEEIYTIIMLHRLVSDGTISVTMPLSILE